MTHMCCSLWQSKRTAGKEEERREGKGREREGKGERVRIKK